MTGGERLYARAPIWLQTLMVTAYGVKLAAIRRGRRYWRWTRFLEESAAWPRERLEAYQAERLREFLAFVSKNSPFYRDRLAGIDVRGVRDLTRLPVTDKETFRVNLSRIRTTDRGVKVHTGGTTGKPLEVVFFGRDLQERFATLDAWRATHGATRLGRRATFSGRIVVPPGQDGHRSLARTNLILRQRLYSCFHLANQNLDAYVRDLERFQPETIDGFPSAIAAVAGHIVASGRTTAVRPRAVFSTSENLYGFQRDIIRTAFRCEARNQYASAEGAPFVVECRKGQLHYDLRTGVIEPGEGSVLVTSFTTHGTPLVRYRIGDQIDLTPGACDCGNENPVVRAIAGREQDYIVSPERGMVGVGLIDIFKKIPPVVKQAQIEQVEARTLVVRLVPDRAGFAEEHLQVLREGLAERVGPGMELQFALVDRIEPEAGGKVLYLKRHPGIEWRSPAGPARPQ